jgi:hypothetical protein
MIQNRNSAVQPTTKARTANHLWSRIWRNQLDAIEITPWLVINTVRLRARLKTRNQYPLAGRSTKAFRNRVVHKPRVRRASVNTLTTGATNARTKRSANP